LHDSVTILEESKLEPAEACEADEAVNRSRVGSATVERAEDIESKDGPAAQLNPI
jgi:hypothetical protein